MKRLSCFVLQNKLHTVKCEFWNPLKIPKGSRGELVFRVAFKLTLRLNSFSTPELCNSILISKSSSCNAISLHILQPGLYLRPDECTDMLQKNMWMSLNFFLSLWFLSVLPFPLAYCLSRKVVLYKQSEISDNSS